MKLLEERMYYDDSWGRKVFVELTVSHTISGDGINVVMKDASNEHNGHSITNSVELAVKAFEEQHPDYAQYDVNYYETYDDEAFDLIEISEDGKVTWTPTLFWLTLKD